MSLKMTPKIDQNEPRERTASETPPGGAQKPQNLLKPTKTPPGEPVGQEGRKAQSAGLPFTRHLLCLEVMPQEGSSFSRLSIFDTLLAW